MYLLFDYMRVALLMSLLHNDTSKELQGPLAFRLDCGNLTKFPLEPVCDTHGGDGRRNPPVQSVMRGVVETTRGGTVESKELQDLMWAVVFRKICQLLTQLPAVQGVQQANEPLVVMVMAPR